MNIIEVQRTKGQQQFRRALVDLLDERPYEEITVGDICARCEMSRTSFYYHYINKEALFEELVADFAGGFTDILRDIRAQGREAFLRFVREGYHPGFVRYFAYFRENRELFTVLLQNGGGVDIADRLARAIDEIGMPGNVGRGGKHIANLSFYTMLCVCHITDFYIIWARQGMEVPDEQMARWLTAYWQMYIFEVME